MPASPRRGEVPSPAVKFPINYRFYYKYPAPSEFYFGEIDCIFSPSKDAKIDLIVLGVKGEIEKEDFDKRQKEQKPT